MNLELPVRLPADEPPPLLGRWKRVYAAVLAYLLALIIALFVITEYFRY